MWLFTSKISTGVPLRYYIRSACPRSEPRRSALADEQSHAIGSGVSGANGGGVCWVNSKRTVPPSVLMQCSKGCGHNPSLDHLVGADEQCRRQLKAQPFRGLGIDHELELDWSLDRQLGRAFPAQDAVDIARRARDRVDSVRPIGHQSAARREL